MLFVTYLLVTIMRPLKRAKVIMILQCTLSQKLRNDSYGNHVVIQVISSQRSWFPVS